MAGTTDNTNFDFMMRMGIWTENLSLPAVLNECMIQSYTGTLRLFPNTQGLGRARFRNLRAAGAFLLSAAYDGKTVSSVTLFSEKGATAKLENPWPRLTYDEIDQLARHDHDLADRLALEQGGDLGVVAGGLLDQPAARRRPRPRPARAACR